MKAAIIDDNELFRHSLNQFLFSRTPDLEEVLEAGSVLTGIKMLQSNCPDIVFMDVQMKDGTAMDILREAQPHDYDVIFIAACEHTDHLVRCIQLAGFEFYDKDSDMSQMHASILNCRYGEYTSKSFLILNKLLETKEATQDVEISLPIGKELNFIRIADIIRLEADPYSKVPSTIFYLDDGNEHFSTRRLSYFENLLIPYGFVNCTAYILVNKSFYKI
jgi:two-component system LytT family response regulator